jgi:CcmD family protein
MAAAFAIMSKLLFLGTFLLTLIAFAFQGTDAFGQPIDSEGSTLTRANGNESTSFRMVQGTEREQLPGGLLMIAAYGVVWLLLLAYMVKIGRLQARTQRDLERLEQAFSPSTSPDRDQGKKKDP